MASRYNHHRRSRRSAAAGFAVGLILTMPVLADVYKWTDPEGRLHFTDRPPPADGRLVSVAQAARPVEASPSPVASASQNSATQSGPSAPPPADAAAAARLKAGVAADIAAHDAQACREAETRYRDYVAARHLFRSGDGNERVYLSDAEMEAARVQARREVEELCGRPP